MKGILKKCRERPECKADGAPIDRDKLQNRSPESFRDEDFDPDLSGQRSNPGAE